MVTRHTQFLLVAAVTLLLGGCFRDGFECTSSADCFDGEACRSGSCVTGNSTTNNDECRPASDEQLCAAAEPCQTNLEVTDSCGTLRQLTCECDEPCVPDTVNTLCGAAEATCGSITATDNCGEMRMVMCGLCTAPESCVENVCTPCMPPVCPDNAQCGVATNSCGETIECGGECTSPEICVDFMCSEPVLQPMELATGDRFGEAIRLDGDYLLVGAPSTDFPMFTNAGVIYVFERIGTGWRQSQVLENPIVTSGRAFGDVFDARAGRLLAVTGGALVSYSRDQQGRYQFDAGQPISTPMSSVTLMENNGFLVGFAEPNNDGDTLAYGQCNMGACQVESSWTPADQSTDPGGIRLGAELDSAGPYTIAGAPADNLNETDDALAEGSYYLFSPSALSSNWSPTSWVSPLANVLYQDYREYPSTAQPKAVGTSVAISEDGFAVAGAPFSDRLADDKIGQILMLSPDETELFSIQNRFTAIGVIDFYQCGYAVALTGGFDDKMVVLSCVFDWPRARSSELADTVRDRTIGDIRRYTVNHADGRWDLNSTPVALPDGEFFDHFGWALEASESQVFVGAPGRDDDRGAVYIYETEDLQR